MPPEGAGSSSEEQPAEATGANKVPLLRDIDATDLFFWKPGQNQQPTELPRVNDKNADYFKRALPENERIAMSMNLIAGTKGTGFVYFVPTPDTWKKYPDEARLPVARRWTPTVSVDGMPTLLFMRYKWSPQDQRTFFEDSHRSRYLKCNIMINPPPTDTPLYAVQYTFFPTSPVLYTAHDSLVLYATTTGYFILTQPELDTIVGRSSRTNRKLGSVAFLWDPSFEEESTEVRKLAQCRQLRQFRASDIENLFDLLMAKCTPRCMAASMCASDLSLLIPRPSAMTASSVGTPLGKGGLAIAASKTGERHIRFRPSAEDTDAQLPRKRRRVTSVKSPYEDRRPVEEDDIEDVPPRDTAT